MKNGLAAGLGQMGQIMGRVMGGMTHAMQKAGVTQAELEAIKAKIEAGEKLAEHEIAKAKAFGEALLPTFEKLAQEFGDEGAKVAGQMRAKFDEILAKVR
jgi:hypothetical protein